MLHEIELATPAGSFYGIVGHTGSGKSTLLSLLRRFYPARPDSIRIDGTPVEAIGEAHFRGRSAWCRRSRSCWLEGEGESG